MLDIKKTLAHVLQMFVVGTADLTPEVPVSSGAVLTYAKTGNVVQVFATFTRSSGTFSTTPTTIGTLPEGARPVVTYRNAGYHPNTRVNITSNGAIQYSLASGTSTACTFSATFICS